MTAAGLRKHLNTSEWQITIIDNDEIHHYQPGWLFIPFGVYTAEDCQKPKREFIPQGVEFVLDEVVGVNPKTREVEGKKNKYKYDWLVVATGCRIMPEEVEGMMDGWGDDIHNFYTLEGAVALTKKMKFFKSGRVVFNIAELPYKCPVAPLEFIFMADWFFTENGVRDDVEIELVTPVAGAFTKPIASRILGGMAIQKNIKVPPTMILPRSTTVKKPSNPTRAKRFPMIC